MPQIRIKNSKVPQKTDKAPDGGYDYSQPVRFKKLSQLKSMFYKTKDLRGDMRSWKHIVQQYERLPYKGPDGNILPNFGLLRGKCDKKLTQFTDFATERKLWFNIDTDFMDESGQTGNWGRDISMAFQKYCIRKWHKKFSEILLACKDMILFSKGALVWMDEDSCYPEHVQIENIWPDSNARMFPESFDVLFIRRRYTAVELYRKIEGEEEMGWRRKAVLSVLRSSRNSWIRSSDRAILMKFRNHSCTQDEEDFLIDCVWAFVTEYDKDGEPKVSRFVFPEVGCIPEDSALDKMQNPPKEDDDSVGYMCYQPDAKECMDEVLTIVAHTVCTNFYEDPSFAELEYTSAKTYDIVFNRILQAVEDNQRVYIETGSADQMKKLSRMRHGNFQALEPGLKLVQNRIERPVMDAFTVIQSLKNQQNENDGNDAETQANPRSKTAHEAALDFSKSQEVSSSSLKIFNQYLGNMGTEMFRRFTHSTKKSGKEYEQFQKFQAFLRSRRVPDEAWDTENVQVESVVDLGAGSPAARLQSAQVVRQALMTPAASPGDLEAQRDQIAAAVGIENVKRFLPDDIEAPTPTLREIGLENDSLSEAGQNPQNVPVLESDPHIMHIKGHQQDAGTSLQMAAKLFQGIGQLNPQDTGVYLKTVQDILIGIDHKLSHAVAHEQMAARVKGANPQAAKPILMQLKQLAQQRQQINKAKDDLEKQLAQMQEARMKQAQQQGGQDPELDHLQKKYKLEEDHLQKMNELDLARNEQKAEQLRNNSAENAAHKRNLETLKTAQDLHTGEVKHAVDVGAKMREHAAELEMKKREEKANASKATAK